MKLELESNAVSSPLVDNQIPSEFEHPENAPEVLEMLREGIKAAQDGNRAEARNLLLKVTEADASNENAWLWLASISEYPEELLVFLNNVLQINPENERALEWSAATKSLIAKTFVQRGIEAAKEDQKKFAKQCFLQAIVHDSQSELAWLWLASVSEATDEKVSHLQKVLSINPENENALSSLKNAKEQEAKSLLPKANAAAISGRRAEAEELLEQIFENAPKFEDAWMLKAHVSESFAEKIAAFEMVLEINPENPVAKANVDSLRMFEENQDVESDASSPSGDYKGVGMLEVDVQEHAEEEFEASEAESNEEAAANDEEDHVAFDAADSNGGIDFHEEEAVPYEEVVSGENWSPSAEAYEPGQEAEAFDDEPAAAESEFAAEESISESEIGNFEDVSFSESDSEDSETAEFEEASDQDGLPYADFGSPEGSQQVDHDYVNQPLDADGVDENEEDSEDDSVEMEADNASDSPVEEQNSLDSDQELSESSWESDENEDNALEAKADDEYEQADGEEPSYGVQEDVKEDEFDAAAAEHDFHGNNEPEMPDFSSSESVSPEFPRERSETHRSCPYCYESNENQSFACHGCKAIFTVSDIDMILSHSKADSEVISKALERMESEKSLRGVELEDLKFMGIGYLNLKDYRKGFEYLTEAAQRDPNDVVLASQLDALAVRLADIEQQQRDNEEMPEGKRILVVDDSPTVRKLIAGKLEKCGHEAICAVDGMDALAKINEVIPDLILLDITMPRMDGYQVCKLIRGNDATKDVPVVMISGKDGFFDKVRGRMAGTSHYITKPFGPETLMKTVKEYIQ